MSSILSDNTARTPVFGTNSILNLPFQVAVKTGTSNDSRDNWTIGYTPDLAVGVWVGNPDYTPMEDTTGITGAGPIWAEFMTFGIYRLTGGHPTPFIPPPGVEQRTVCTASGTQPSRWCPSTRQEYFAVDQPPLPPSADLWQEVNVDTWTNLLASPECEDFTEERLVINVTAEWAHNWIYQEELGKKWARDLGFDKIVFMPTRQCKPSDPRPDLEILGLRNGQTLTDPSLDINIVADATSGFQSWRLEWGINDHPDSWSRLTGDVTTPVSSGTKVYTWDLRTVRRPQITLRLYMTGENGVHAETRVVLNLDVPAPPPTATQAPTPTQVPSDTPSEAPTETTAPSPSPTPEPTETPTETPTEVPTEPPTPTDTPG
jgi:membrane peptidoglycan carboxypeptidase